MMSYKQMKAETDRLRRDANDKELVFLRERGWKLSIGFADHVVVEKMIGATHHICGKDHALRLEQRADLCAEDQPEGSAYAA